MTLPGWLNDLPEQIAASWHRCTRQHSRALPSRRRRTHPAGERIALGYSCYAHKVAYTLACGMGCPTPSGPRGTPSFAASRRGAALPHLGAHNAFFDPVVADY
jgi:hypothetical protein